MAVIAASWPIQNTKFHFKRSNFIAAISRRNFDISSSSFRSNFEDTSAIRRSSCSVPIRYASANIMTRPSDAASPSFSRKGAGTSSVLTHTSSGGTRPWTTMPSSGSDVNSAMHQAAQALSELDS